MAKYELLDEPVFVQSCEQIQSKYGREIWEIEVVGIKTQRVLRTYCDPHNNNYLTWQPIIEIADTKGIVISNLKFKDPQKGIVNADSQLKVEYVVTKAELAETLAEFWDNQSKFNQLFGT